MTLEDKKALAIDLLMSCARGDATAVERLICDDFHFQFMQQADSWSADGEEVSSRLDKAQFLKFGVTAGETVTRDGLRFDIEQALCEGDTVALFGTSEATALSGAPYRNTYCWRFVIADGRVSDMREYCDTHLAQEVLFGAHTAT